LRLSPNSHRIPTMTAAQIAHLDGLERGLLIDWDPREAP
jgi:hypothetical protein